MQHISVSAHGVPAVEVYSWFSSSAEQRTQKQATSRICARLNFWCLNNTYYIQSVAQLHAFVGQLKPKGHGDETAAQLKDRFFREHAYLLQALPDNTEG